MYCAQCGARIDDDDRFCRRCGARVEPLAEEGEACVDFGIDDIDEAIDADAADVSDGIDDAEASHVDGDADGAADPASPSDGGVSRSAALRKIPDPGQTAVLRPVGCGGTSSDAGETAVLDRGGTSLADRTLVMVGAGELSDAEHDSYDPMAGFDVSVFDANHPEGFPEVPFNQTGSFIDPDAGKKGTRTWVVVLGVLAAVLVIAALVVVPQILKDGGAAETDDGSSPTSLEGADDAPSSSAEEKPAPTAGSDDAEKPAAETEEADEQGDYILPESATRYYTPEELGSLSDKDLYIARNEIFARHGRSFSGPLLGEYFGGKSWYKPAYTAEEFDSMPSPFNEYESANIETIRKVEQERGSSYL